MDGGRNRTAERVALGIVGLVLALAVVVAGGSAAFADDPPPAAPPAATPPAAPAAAPGPAAYLEAEPTEGVDLLPEVIVEAPSLTRRPIQESIFAVNAISRRELDRTIARAAADAFQWHAGLWNTQSSSGHMGTPVIRGMTGNQVLFVFDGVRLSNDRTPPGPGGYWEMVDMEVVDHIEVVRSPDSVMYGSQAIGGVTAFYTAWPTPFTECGTCTGGRTRVSGGIGGENYVRGRLEGWVASPRTRVAAGGTLWRSDDMRSPSGLMAPTGFDAENADFRLERRVTSTGTLGLSFFGMWKDWHGNYIFPHRDQANRRDRQVGIVRWLESSPTALWDGFEARLALVHYGQWYKRYERDLSEEVDVLTPQIDFIAHKRVGCNHLLTYGLQAYRDDVDMSRDQGGTITKPIPEGYFQTLGLYVQDEWDVNPRLRLTGGLRFDVSNAHTNPDAATTDPLIDPDDVRIDQWDTALTGKIGALYQATPWLGLFANASRGYRFPSLENLAGFVQHPDEIAVGNPNVKPEYSWNVEAGFNVSGKRFRGSAVFFYTWYDDLIIATYGEFNGQSWIDRNGNMVQDPDESIYLTSNAGSAHTHGIELEGEYVILPRCGLSAFGNFTWWVGSFDPSPTEPLGMPTNGTLGLLWQPSSHFWVQGAAHMVRHFDQIDPAFYYAEQFFFADPQDDASGTLRARPDVPGYTSFDLRAGVDLADRVTVTVGVENLMNKEYRPYGGRHDAPATSFVASVTIRL